MSDVAKVDKLPQCDMCVLRGYGRTAAVDGKTRYGPWAYMCQGCFELHGVGLGTGLGQRLVLTRQQPTITDKEHDE